jgi:hypothetical protein
MYMVRKNLMSHFSHRQFSGSDAKVSQYLVKRHATQTYVGMQVQTQVVLTTALDGDWLTASCPGHLTPKTETPVRVLQDTGLAPRSLFARRRPSTVVHPSASHCADRATPNNGRQSNQLQRCTERQFYGTLMTG